MENPKVLKEWFHRVDSNNNGSINASQLKNALAVGNLDFPLAVVQQMIRMYDFNRNGTMDFEDISFFQLNSIYPLRLEAPSYFILLKEFVALNKFLLKVQNAFSQLDRGNGFLTLDDVYQALVKLGFSLDSPAFFTACESFDQNKMGVVRLDAFISLCIFVQSARNLFNSFDTTKQGRVTLDFNQFVYCTANCRM